MRAKNLIVLVLMVAVLGCMEASPVSPLIGTGQLIPAQIMNIAGPAGGPVKSASEVRVTVRCTQDPEFCEGLPMRVTFQDMQNQPMSCATDISARATFADVLGNVDAEATLSFVSPLGARWVTIVLYSDLGMTKEIISGKRRIEWVKKGDLRLAYDMARRCITWDSLGFSECQFITPDGIRERVDRQGEARITDRGTYSLSCIRKDGKIENRLVEVPNEG